MGLGKTSTRCLIPISLATRLTCTEVIEKINDLFSGDHPDSSVQNVVTHAKDRLEESETLQQQAQNNSLAQFSASPDLQNEFVGAVIGAMDSSDDLSAQILNTPDLSQKLLDELVPIIYTGLKATGVNAHSWGLSCRRSVHSFPAAVLVELRIA